MVNSLYRFIIRQFAGKIAALISSIILFAVLQAFGWIASKSPEIAATIHPQQVADWLSTLVIALLNIAANKYHLDNATVQSVENAIKDASPEVVIKAQPVNPPQK